MPAEKWPTVDFVRMFVERGIGVKFDRLGLPIDDSADAFASENAMVQNIGDLDRRRALVVLGEPGLGKSSMLDRWCRGRRSHATPSVHVYHEELGGCTSQDILRSDIFDPAREHLESTADATVCICLDSLDQGLVALPGLARILKKEFRRLDPTRVTLRLTSRVANWDGDLESAMRELWGEEHFCVRELLPLSEPEVRRALKQWALPVDEFMRELGEHRIGPLAGNLITLQFLASYWREHSALPENRLQAYDKGCKHLVASRADPVSTRVLSDEDRLIAAARCAAASTLAEIPTVFLGPRVDCPEKTLSVAELCEGEECWAGRTLNMPTEPQIRHALESAIFSARGGGSVGIAHQSYAEYLTAWYLHHRDLPVGQLVNLLTVPRGWEGRRVAPQLAEVACWLAWMDEEFRNWLLAEDLDIVLKSDAPIADDAHKAEVLERVLAALSAGDLMEGSWATVREYRRFCHPGLATQLRPWISETLASPRAYRFAVRVAIRCEVCELVPDFVQIALDPAKHHDWRVLAGRAVSAIGRAGDKQKLADLIECTAAQDPDDELRALALECAWPANLSVEKLLAACCQRADPNMSGSFHRFWRDGWWAGLLTENDLIRALRWLQVRSRQPDQQDAFSDACSCIWAKAIERLESEPVRSAFSEAVASLDLFAFRRFVSRRRADVPGGAPEFSDALRLDVAFRLLQAGAEAGKLGQHAYELLQTRHLPALLERVKRAGEPAIRRRLAACIESLTHDACDDRDWSCVDAVFQAAETSQEIHEALQKHFGTVELGSQRASEMRETHKLWLQVDAPVSPAPEASPLDQLKAALGRCEEGTSAAFRGVIQALSRAEGGVGWPRADLHACGLWKDLEPSLRQRILESALRFLRLEPTPSPKEPSNYLTSCEVSPAAVVALVFHANPDLLAGASADCLERWVPSLFLQSPLEERAEDERKLLGFLLDRFPHTVHRVLSERLCWEARVPDLVRKAMDWIRLSHSDALWEAALDIAAQVDTPKEFARFIVGAGADHRHPTAVCICRAWLEDVTLDPTHRAFAACTLIRCQGVEGWRIVSATLVVDDALCGAWAYDMRTWHGDPAFMNGLEPAACESLFDRLEGLYPCAEAPPFTAEWTPRLAVEELKGAVLTVLRDARTQEAVDALGRLATRWPSNLKIGADLLEARSLLSRTLWLSVPPAILMTMARRADVRLIRSEADLMDAVIASLERLQVKLHGSVSAGPMAKPDLWDEASRKPKSEERLSDYVARHLRNDLRAGGVLALREVEVRRRRSSGIGERLDVLVTLTPGCQEPSIGSELREPLLLVIEVKGCWNKDLWIDLKDQFVGRYLKEFGCRQGIYLVGYFQCDRWSDENGGKARSRSNTGADLAALRRRLNEECQHVAGAEAVARGFALDVTY